MPSNVKIIVQSFKSMVSVKNGHGPLPASSLCPYRQRDALAIKGWTEIFIFLYANHMDVANYEAFRHLLASYSDSLNADIPRDLVRCVTRSKG